ncbi:MAG TPA: hypothetical protein VKP65_07635 [Rhodothermales bacterium]|nr:hypothetical protein [Rhodothermales bacterium]
MQAAFELYAQAFQQLASISAVLGGLAFTAAAALLAAGAGTNNPDALGKPAKITVATAVGSAVCLILGALMWSLMAADISRAVANNDVSSASDLARLNWMPSLALIAGVVLFFISIGTSGWIASRKLGLLTSIAALGGGIALLLMISLFVA